MSRLDHIAYVLGWWICDRWLGNGNMCPGCRLATWAARNEED